MHGGYEVHSVLDCRSPRRIKVGERPLVCPVDNRDRYLQSSVGSTLWGCSDQRVMVPIKTAVAHKLFVTFSASGGAGGGGGGVRSRIFHRNKCYIRVLLLKDNTTAIGSAGLCRHNFEHNTISGALGTMLA